MKTIRPTIKNFSSDSKEALRRLVDGQCVAVPTETVYGLAADACNGNAVARIFETKGRPSFNPLIAHVSDVEMAEQSGVLNESARSLVDAFWPGPLTIVVPKLNNSPVHELVTAGLETVALRMPSGKTRDLIASFGRPVAAPSANCSGRVSPTTAQHVADEFADHDLLILDDGPCTVGLESTIVKCTPDEFVILRPGAVTAEMIEQVAGKQLQSIDSDSGSRSIQAPGMMQSHYAPECHVLLDWENPPQHAALLAFGTNENRTGFVKVLNLSDAGDLNEAAANLYAFLKQLDSTEVNAICVERIPNEGLGIAINDRLTRAAAPRE